MDSDKIAEKPPGQSQIGWNDYVMGLFDPIELDEFGNPRIDGLRRVTLLLFGFYDSLVTITQYPSPENANRATAICELTFNNWNWNANTTKYEPTNQHKVSDAADANHTNVKGNASAHPVAMASTRAEARALRKKLRIRTLAAEESDLIDTNSEKIKDTQINMINLLSKRNNVNVNKLMNFKRETPVTSIDKLTMEEGAKLIKLLNEIQQGKKKAEELNVQE